MSFSLILADTRVSHLNQNPSKPFSKFIISSSFVSTLSMLTATDVLWSIQTDCEFDSVKKMFDIQKSIYRYIKVS